MGTAKEDNRKRKVDKIWEEIFETRPVFTDIESNGYFQISSSEINEYQGAEARLLTKFDYWDSLPYIFQKNNLSILPVGRGSYIIAQFNAYYPLNIDSSLKPVEVSFPYWIRALNKSDLSSEAKVLNCTFVTGILKDVIEEEVKPTINGRMSSGTWDFYINSLGKDEKIKIKNNKSQCQIDGGFEGLSKFALIKAKNSISKDFIVRQLYYPYRLWHQNLNGQKNILPIFLVYSSGVFHFLIYHFENFKEYNSLKLIKQKSYIIRDKSVTLKDIIKIMKEVEFVKEPDIPFPQADTFERVVDLLEAIYEESLTPEEISLHYDFDYRQGQYYSRAGMYLNLLKNNNGTIEITEEGKNILKKNKKEKYLALATKILEHKVFWETLQIHIKSGMPPTKKVIYNEVMKKNKELLYKTGKGYLNETTLTRRASTVKGWVEWILSLQDIV